MGPEVDVAIVGAGPAGAASALYAARAGMRVALFDRAAFPRDKVCGEGIMPPGRRVLEELGLLAPVLEAGAHDLRAVEFGLAGAPARRIAFPAPEAAGPTASVFGLGVRRLAFDALLVEHAAAQPGIAFHPSTAVAGITPGNGSPPLVRTSAGDVAAGHVIVADGLHSSLRHQLGWTVGPRPPHRYGVMAHWTVDRPQDPWIGITISAGLEVYEAPVGPHERLVSILCHRSRMRAFGGNLAREYRSIVDDLVPGLAGAELTGEVRAIGPFNYRARTVARDRVYLVGDAAGFVDPISAEGLAAGLTQARAVIAALRDPHPERAYRRAHRRLTRDPRRVSALLVSLASTPARAARGIRGIDRRPALMAALLGINFGYWGFDRISVRDWIRLLAGR
ncbi:MAG TPA: FAD-dependent oxidoreductase [Candidatus Limnocylindrales bacterium]|nr:FAD-dependent oxidoreductase [Candidatus Limnocylindrales bacterium]